MKTGGLGGLTEGVLGPTRAPGQKGEPRSLGHPESATGSRNQSFLLVAPSDPAISLSSYHRDYLSSHSEKVDSALFPEALEHFLPL